MLPPGYPRTMDFARCRWICTEALGCETTEVGDVEEYGPVGNVTGNTATCLVPPGLHGDEPHAPMPPATRHVLLTALHAPCYSLLLTAAG